MNGIKKHSFTFFNVVLFLSFAFTETFVKGKEETSMLDRGRVITWSTNDESTVKVFEIWRSSSIDTISSFDCIARVLPMGNHSDYLYCDTSLTTMMGDAYTYKIVAHGESSYLVERTIGAKNFGAAVQQPWVCVETVFQ